MIREDLQKTYRKYRRQSTCSEYYSRQRGPYRRKLVDTIAFNYLQTTYMLHSDHCEQEETWTMV